MSYAEQSIRDFLDDVASHEVTPAGGTTAALGGAMGTALCEMVCLHTIERDEYADVAEEMAERRDDLERQRELLLELADADAAVVDELLAAFRDDAGQTAAQKKATGVPLAIADACVPVLEHATVVIENGNTNAVPDAVIGSHLVYAALEATVFTVRTNLGHLSDPAFVDEMETRAADLERSAERSFEQIMATLE